MKKNLQISIAFALLLVCVKAQAQTDGTLDTSFNVGTFSSFTSLQSTAVQPDGKILVGGDFTTYNGQTQRRIARLNAGGSLDTSFNIGEGFVGNDEANYTYHINAIAIQPDGKILAVGYFNKYDNQNRNSIVRLNTDGSLDTSFNIGTGFNTDAMSIALQPDGKILVGGVFTSYNGISRNGIVRLSTDGTLDTSFAVGTGFDDFYGSPFITSLAIQPDGKILAGGWFDTYNGQSVNKIARLNTDGTLDTSFNIGVGFVDDAFVDDIAIQPDGKILAGGGFTSYNGQTVNRITRLNLDGSLDSSFNIGTGFNNRVRIIALQPDGKILVGGLFVSYNGQTINRISRLNVDGSLDTSFETGTGFGGGTIRTTTLQPDGKILVTGDFTSYNGQTVDRIARLHNDVPAQSQCPVDVELTSQAEVNAFFVDYPNCTEIEGYLLIGSWDEDSDITDLSPLNSLISVGGEIMIYGNPQLTTLSGLNNLTFAKGLWIEVNPQINSLSALNNLTSVGEEGFIIYQSALTSLSGLENLTSVGAYFALYNNDVLTSLSGVENLTSVGWAIGIGGNALLTDISALQNVDFANIDEDEWYGLDIYDNPLLEVCNLPNFCTYLQEGGENWIEGNAGDCITEEAVLNACSLSIDDNEISKITIYPNPATTMVYLSNLPESSDIKVVDITGKVVIDTFKTTGTTSIRTENLNSGVYFVQIKNNDNVTVKKLIVNRN